ncbi:MAG: RNB domain-containing ribonuclease, partial [Geminicoccales bacterium]
MARSKKRTRPSGPTPLPSREQILDFLRQQSGRAGKREIARAFGIHGAQRQELKDLIAEMKRDGSLEGERRRLDPSGPLPPVAVLEVSGLDSDGELLAKPANWNHKEAPPKIYVTTERRSRSALAVGERVLARLKLCEDGSYEAGVIRVLEAAPRRIIGIYETGSEGGRLRPTEKRARSDFVLRAADAAGAKPGELVLAELKPGHPRLGLRDVRVVERLGRMDSARALSLIAIHEHGLPTVFAAEALAEAEAAQPVPLGERLDLRALPLVTIDGADARDFDDAVWAERDNDPKNRDGWHLIVAIADVAHYVRPGSALDQDAYQRGNSAYFPVRVVPLLPEALSNGWC